MVRTIKVPVRQGPLQYPIDAAIFSKAADEESIGTFKIDNDIGYDEVSKDADKVVEELKAAGNNPADYITLPHWNEVVLAVSIEHYIEPPAPMKFLPVSSYRVQARRNGFSTFELPQAGVTIMPVTLDERLLVGGVRGGQDLAGTVAQIGGSIEYDTSDRHPLFVAAESEMTEETGFGLTNPRIIGHFYEPKHYKSRTFVMIGEINATSKDIIKLHQQAMAIYSDAKAKGIEEQEARLAIKEAGLLNVDAWEHTELLFLPDLTVHRLGLLTNLDGRFNPIGTANAAILRAYTMLGEA